MKEVDRIKWLKTHIKWGKLTHFWKSEYNQGKWPDIEELKQQ